MTGLVIPVAALLVLLIAVGVVLLVIPHARLRREFTAQRGRVDRLRLEGWREFEGLLQSISDAVVAVDDQGVIVGWNRSAETMFGWNAEDVLMTPAEPLMSEDMKQFFSRHSVQLAERGTSDFVGQSTRVNCATRSGRLLPCEMSLAVWKRESRLFSGGIFRDVSARESVERELVRLARAVDHASEAIIITEADTTIVYVNPAFERVSGYSRDEVLGLKPSALKSGRHDQAFYRELWATLARGEAWTGMFVNRRKDGTMYEEEANISPVRDASGAVVNYVAVKRDVTRENALREQLQQAQKLEAVGRLASGIAHEINTPMQYAGDSARYLARAFQQALEALQAFERAARGPAEVSMDAAVEERLREALEAADFEFTRVEIPRALDRVLDGINRVSDIVRAMKEFAHPERRERTPADLNDMLQTTLTVARNEYKQVADIETEYGELPAVSCHVGELNQVFLNLLVNAAHAVGERVAGTRERGIIGIRTRLEGDQAVVEVRDTGAGIPEAARTMVFEPFFTTKPIGKGTGQGLAIARSIIVDKHGGDISFATELGRGTTFTIRIPIRSPHLERKAA